MSTEMTDERLVRTYRGRSLEELIPKIRAELGSDAIILREREGLTGGFNGFFQQRCVEVDAQAAPAIDFYDEEDAALPHDAPQTPSSESAPAPAAADPANDAGATTEWSPPVAPGRAPGWPHERVAPPTPPAPHVVPEPSPYAGAAQTYTESSYQPEAVAPQPVAPEAVAPEPVVPELVEAPHAPAPASEELTFAQRLALARQEREAAHDREAALAEPEREPVESFPTAEEPDSLQPVDSPPEASPAPAPLAAPPELSGPGTRRPPVTPRPFPSPAGTAGGVLDNAVAGAIARELTAQGISEAWAHELIVTAAAHLTPFISDGDLRAGVRAVIAGGIMAPPPLPSAGAAVAFVGPGGSGKSRCSAALACAYRRASTLATHVISLGAGPRAADVAGLLAESDIQVDLLHGAAAADAIARGRERGMVVVDTDTASPVDTQAVAALGDTLGPLGLDAIYLTLPATMSAPAARGLFDGLEALAPTALVITHADEANELGIVAELAYLSGLPIAFIHGGLNIDTALQATDPAGIAARILP